MCRLCLIEEPSIHGVDMTAITKDLASCILDLARDSSSQGRGTLLKAITNLYEKTEYSQSDAERELMVDILGRLVGEIEKVQIES